MIQPSTSYALANPDGIIVDKGSKKLMQRERKAKVREGIKGYRVWFSPNAKIGDDYSKK